MEQARSYMGGQTATLAPRFDSPPQAPQVTALDEIRARLAGVQESVSHLGGRLSQIADRAAGSQPSGGVSANGGQKVAPAGTLGEIVATLDSLQGLLGYAHEQANRLERIA